MNERIKELAEQAMETVDVSKKLGMPGTDLVFNKEKFAELIVKECADKIEHDYKYVTGTDTKWNTAFTIACDLKQHFGLE